MLKKALVSILTLLTACGGSNEEGKKKQQGGDHVPEDKVYDAFIPEEIGGLSLDAQTYSAPYLRKHVHVNERYDVCFSPAEVSAAELQGIERRLKESAASTAQQGLETVVNQALNDLRRVEPSTRKFSSRITIDAVWTDGHAACNFVIYRRPAASFPFNHADFVGQRTVMLNVGQLQDPVNKSHKSGVPVGFLPRELGPEAMAIAAQYLIARYMGLGESPAHTSYLSGHLDPSSSAGRWWLAGADDSAIVYAFGLAYYKILKPRDLERAQYYRDALGLGDAETDPLLTLPAGAMPPRFAATPGHRDLTGARLAYEPFKICVRPDSAKSPNGVQIAAALTTFSVAADGSLAALLHLQDVAFNPQVQVADPSSPCGLVVAFRDETQYPFDKQIFSGLYAHEGRIKTADGKLSPVPVIYVNMSSVSADKIRAVFQHEAAHFMGLKHSRSQSSLLAPAGAGEDFDPAGGDDRMFTGWATEARKARGARN